ncbi:MAG: methyltransferase domain-containing protein [Chitinispirillales bacterium]|jgi:ubiquinone/menaquinone biosynthesis C-methylase UbiE|nr:methyltransferase domain-containing protein [Chitinispirillales bacterium]
MEKIIEQVKEYYGKQLQSKNDLQTGACCAIDRPPKEIRAILPLIADEIHQRFYGCGSPLPPLLEGKTLLDLGCGTGRDVYIASKLAGQTGSAIGVDMTTEQIETAIKYQEEQRERFGFKISNVKFMQGYIEDLKSIGIEDNSIDVVISNCVINLSPAKELVFKEIYRILKPGGELYFSDIFVDRRIPEPLTTDPVLRGECLTGALYTEDFRRLMTKTGWLDFRYTNIRELAMDNEEIEAKLGFATFSSRTVRAFKLNDLEDICEDYGQVAWYNGNIPEHPHFFDLDDSHRFLTNKPMLVCGNTASMVSNTRYAKAFKVMGDRSVHFGKFLDCGTNNTSTETGSGSCC